MASDLAEDPEALIKKIVIELKDVLYHNLKTVSALYKDAFGIELIPAKDHRDVLFPAIGQRHHCVHRNGQDKEGNKLNVFEDEYVSKVITVIRCVIADLETRINDSLPM